MEESEQGQQLLRPPALRAGDVVAAVSLSWGGPGAFPARYEAGKRQLEEAFEVRVVEMPHTLSDPEWLEHHPEARAADLMAAFADPAIRGIISTIGGDESIRLLRYLDPKVVRANPKVFMGYSDTTVSHLFCLKAGLGSFYGPAVMAGFGESGGMFPYMVESVRQILFETEPPGRVEPNREGWTVEHVDWADTEAQKQQRALQPAMEWKWLQGMGVGRGRLIGGCLDVLEFLRGTDVWPSGELWEGAILFLETSEEAPSPEVLARALRSYAAMGILQRLSGILFGRPGGDVPVETFTEYEEALLKVVAQEEGLTELPIVTRMDFGHTDPMMVLPYGTLAEVDCEAREFRIVEAAVR